MNGKKSMSYLQVKVLTSVLVLVFVFNIVILSIFIDFYIETPTFTLCLQWRATIEKPSKLRKIIISSNSFLFSSLSDSWFN